MIWVIVVLVFLLGRATKKKTKKIPYNPYESFCKNCMYWGNEGFEVDSEVIEGIVLSDQYASCSNSARHECVNCTQCAYITSEMYGCTFFQHKGWSPVDEEKEAA